MAQNLFLIPLSEEVAQTFDRDLVLQILGKGAASKVDFACCYPDGSGGEAYVTDDDNNPTKVSLGFCHFGGKTFMERMFELADALPIFLIWSDYYEGEPCGCVTRAERLALLREEAKELDIVVARDPSHLNWLVKGVTFEENGW